MVDEWGAVDIFCLDIRKAFIIFSHKILIAKLRKYRLDKQIARCIEK